MIRRGLPSEARPGFRQRPETGVDIEGGKALLPGRPATDQGWVVKDGRTGRPSILSRAGLFDGWEENQRTGVAAKGDCQQDGDWCMGSWRRFRHGGLFAGLRKPAGFAKSATGLAICAALFGVQRGVGSRFPWSLLWREKVRCVKTWCKFALPPCPSPQSASNAPAFCDPTTSPCLPLCSTPSLLVPNFPDGRRLSCWRC